MAGIVVPKIPLRRTAGLRRAVLDSIGAGGGMVMTKVVIPEISLSGTGALGRTVLNIIGAGLLLLSPRDRAVFQRSDVPGTAAVKAVIVKAG